jgi:hypothetical protein
MGGYGNIDDTWLNNPEGAYYGLTMRTYDPKTAVWTIGWFDGRNPSHDIDPPVRGQFVNGVGTSSATSRSTVNRPRPVSSGRR